MLKRLKRGAFALAIICLVVSGTVTSSWELKPPKPSGGGEEVYGFSNLAQMLATSDFVIEATVTSVQPGTTVYDSPGAIEGRMDFKT